MSTENELQKSLLSTIRLSWIPAMFTQKRVSYLLNGNPLPQWSQHKSTRPNISPCCLLWWAKSLTTHCLPLKTDTEHPTNIFTMDDRNAVYCWDTFLWGLEKHHRLILLSPPGLSIYKYIFMYSLIYRRSPLLPSILSPLINSWTISQVSANFGLNNYWNLYPVEKFYPFLRNNNLVRSLSLSLETESQSCQRCLRTFKPITSSLFFQQLLKANSLF